MRRAREALAEYAVLFLTVDDLAVNADLTSTVLDDLTAVALRRLTVGFFCAASAVEMERGRHTTTPSSVETSLATKFGRTRRTKPP